MDLAILFFLAISFWFFQKIADWHNEHGLKWFPFANVFFGIIWWGIGFYLVGYSQIIATAYLAIVFYWIYKLKIDHINHAISILIILFSVFLSQTKIDVFSIVCLLFSYIAIDIIKHRYHLEKSYFFKYRLQFVLVPIIYSIVIQDIFGWVIIFNLFGVSLANKIFKIK